jgi:hypothetical protein
MLNISLPSSTNYFILCFWRKKLILLLYSYKKKKYSQREQKMDTGQVFFIPNILRGVDYEDSLFF